MNEDWFEENWPTDALLVAKYEKRFGVIPPMWAVRNLEKWGPRIQEALATNSPIPEFGNEIYRGKDEI